MTMSRQSVLDCNLRAVPHMPALPARLEKFVAFLWQIAPFWPVLPTLPAYKSFAVNKTPVARHLNTVEVAGSSPAAPTMKSMTCGRRTSLLRDRWSGIDQLFRRQQRSGKWAFHWSNTLARDIP